MSETNDAGEPRWVDLLISGILRGGVLLSVCLVVAGIALTFIHHHDYFSSRPALGSLIDARANYTDSITDVLSGVRDGRGQALAMLGLLVLIATPVARVAVSVVVFIIENDALYTAITAAVLLLLVVSFVLGAAG